MYYFIFTNEAFVFKLFYLQLVAGYISYHLIYAEKYRMHGFNFYAREVIILNYAYLGNLTKTETLIN